MNINELKKRIADAGCVGAGGAGFPTAVKVAVSLTHFSEKASIMRPATI